jgi:hypothetical protein
MNHSARAILVMASVLAGSVLAADGPAAAKKPAAPAIRPVASFQEIMLAEVNPAATFLWNSVSTENTPGGTIEHRPVSDEDWLAVRHQALILIEAGNLLLVEGRPIVAHGATVKDAEQPGILGPEQIRRAIGANRGKFVGFVHALQDAGRAVIDATEKKDAAALSDAGGSIDEACEACHKSYWYPPAR